MASLFFRAAQNLSLLSVYKIPISTAPRPGGSFGALAANFSKSCDCRTSGLRLLGAPSAGASVVVALRKDYLADGVFTFFVHWPCLRFLLIFATNFQLIFVFPILCVLFFFLFLFIYSWFFRFFVSGCGCVWLAVAGRGWLWLAVAGCGCGCGCVWLAVASYG